MAMIRLVFIMMVAGLELSSSTAVKEMEQVDQTTYGTIVLCDKTEYHWNGTWTPKNFKSNGLVTVYIDFILNANFDSGILNFQWYIRESDQDPWIMAYGMNKKITCTGIQELLERSNFDIKEKPKNCPYQKGDRLNFTFGYEFFNDIPIGYTMIKAKVTNGAGHVCGCFTLTTFVEASK